MVNLACKTVIATITNIKYIDDTVEGYEDYEPGEYSRDCIAIFQSLVNAVSAIYYSTSSLSRKHRFITAISKSSDSQNMSKNILIRIINYFVMYPPGDLQHY